ncbi:AAA family ATPase [Streptomyces sp. NPDC053474]|uniref:AAA family ATPase n=1 Tax=Streptomyces sp. NPDC053474 TaxID=3365704 RepID=UPI0037D8BFBE
MPDSPTHPAAEPSTPPGTTGSRFHFTSAARQQRFGRILLDGPPGAGTLYTSLALATSIGSRVAVIDTQRGRASTYAGTFQFDTCPPLSYYSPGTLITALAHCAAQRYDTVVIATLSHFWTGRGGVRAQADRAAKRISSTSPASGWREVRPAELRMLDAVFGYPGHVVATVRDKLDYVTEPDETGRFHRRIIGLAPVGCDGMQYDWDIAATMDHTHTLVVVKAPTDDLSGAVEPKPGARFAARITAWLDQGEPVEPPHDLAAEALQPDLSFDDLADLMQRVRTRQAEGYPLLLDDSTGTTLGAHISERGNELRRDR